MNLDSIIKNIDPVISNILNRVIDGNHISEDETRELFNSNGIELNMIVIVANHLCKIKKRDIVTYVVNRNINFTNVCIKRCGFCAFSRDFREEEGYYLPIEEIIRRAKDNPFFVFEELNRHKDKFTKERFEEIEIYLKNLIRKGQTSYLKKEALKTLYIDFDKPSEFNGNKLLDFEKIEQMLRFYSQHNFNLYKVKLMKLLWYADAFHFKNANQSISGLVYAHKTYGALPIGFNDLLYAFNDSISVTEEYFDCVGEEEEKITYKIKNLKNVDQNKLKPSEIAALDKVNSFFKKMGSKQISEYMHKEIAYNNTQDGTLISFKLAAKIKELN